MIYAMSDIHGCLDELEAKMKFVNLNGDNQLILLGDYIDYGWKVPPGVRVRI
jgi:serine/threonine protein phosphatase 1